MEANQEAPPDQPPVPPEIARKPHLSLPCRSEIVVNIALRNAEPPQRRLWHGARQKIMTKFGISHGTLTISALYG